MMAAEPRGSTRPLDVICLGRAAVDLYGQQIGSPLEDVQSFAKYVGGSSANVAVGLARLGLRSAMLTRVGDEQMGRFVRSQLGREGVDVSHVITDPRRLTGLVLLGISGHDDFPHVFYRENCADLALATGDFDAAFMGSARALAVTGTHLSTAPSAEVAGAAIRLAKSTGTQVVLDIDYRPVLWGLVPPAAGANRFVPFASATARLQAILPDCDLVVGTEEEFQVAAGTSSPDAAVALAQSLTRATLVVKRGAAGCSIFAAGTRIDVPGFPVEVLNTLGAGDAFLAGFLASCLRGDDWASCARHGNACGALTVSRHGCAPALPSQVELEAYLERATAITRPDLDAVIPALHAATTMRRPRRSLYVLAFDHRRQLEKLMNDTGTPFAKIPAFKRLVAAAVERVAARNDAAADLGIIADDRYGRDALLQATRSGRWVGRAIEIPGSRPLEFEPRDHCGLPLLAWPAHHVVKCLVLYHPDDPQALRVEQEHRVRELFRDTADLERELLLEIVTTGGLPVDEMTVARAVRRFYNIGVRPAWWKLEPQSASGWREVSAVIEEQDPHCNGILVLGLDAAESALSAAFRTAAAFPLCRGFAIGRSIFGQPAREWASGRWDDEAVIVAVAERYERLIHLWQAAQAGH